MQLEDYFDFLSADEIFLKGHCIGINNILDYYLGLCPALMVD
ncbi:hypothetical protein [Nostoc sp.]